MSGHTDAMNQYKPSIGTKLTYPVDSQYLNSTDDPWEFQPGYNKNTPTPTDKLIWAQTQKASLAEHIAAYKREYIKQKGTYSKPFEESTMMVAPVKWDTGYSSTTAEALSEIATMQAEAIKVKDAIGVVNNAIQRLEGLLYQVQGDLKEKKRLRANTDYAALAADKAPEVLATLNSDISTLEAMEIAYGNQLADIRSDGRILNQELEILLRNYKESASKLNINDNFARELRQAAGSGAVKGFTLGGLSGVLAAGGLLFLIAQMRRSTRRVRSTQRGADGLFFRA